MKTLLALTIFVSFCDLVPKIVNRHRCIDIQNRYDVTMKRVITRKVSLWTGAILTTLSIMLMAAYGRAVQRFMENLFGKGILLTITAVFVVFGVCVFKKYVFREKKNRLQRFILFSLVTGLYTWRLLSLHVHVERFHLIEYGILAVLVCFGAMESKQEWLSLGWGLAAAWFVGLSDEFYQWWLPSRVGEWRDVVINIQSGVLGLLSLGLLQYSSFKFRKPEKKFIVFFIWAMATLVLLSGLFIVRVHMFGIRNMDPEIGRFNSVYTADVLLKANLETYEKTRALSESDGKEDSLTDFHYSQYNREAKEHFDRTLLLVELGKLDEAHSEFMLVTRYYQPWMQGNARYFDNETKNKVTSVPPLPAEEFESRVMDWLFISSTGSRVLMLSLILSIVLYLTGAVYFFLKL